MTPSTRTAAETLHLNANRIHADLTDYTPSIKPSLLYKVIYLTEFERAIGPLNPDMQHELDELRTVIRWACGIR